jgi:serine/threonine protein phosphatase PrpC
MEDRHKIFRDFNGLPHCAVMAVFDGHRGFECAEYCSENLSDAILSEWGENGNDIPSTLKKVFQKLHLAFVKHWTEKERRDMHKSTADPKSKKKRYPGCTATVCFFWGDDVYVANAGDSRAVLGHHPTGNDEVDADETTWSTALSEDHCASSNAKELERVKNSSENVKIRTLENGQIRVGDAGLAVTRALGDWDCTESGGVLSEPEVIKKTLSADTDAFITIACDGLWDVCTNTDMCSIIRDTVKEPSMCAKRLGCEALNRLSDDNISVLVGILGNEGTFAKVSWKSTYNDGFSGLN